MKRSAVFAKRPEPGRVKTRLSPALPADLACDLYRAMLADALAAASACRADECWLAWAEAPGEKADDAPPAGFRTRAQSGADLGERLTNAFGEWLQGEADRTIIIGADCPDLDSVMIDRAFEALEETDLVLGPTRDGGYYLIGLRRAVPSLFRDVAWSTPNVFEQTLERARRASLSVETLPPLDDLDTPEDLIRWIAREAIASTSSSGRTATALVHMGLLPGSHA